MHDIKWIRNNPQEFDKALQKRGLPAQSADIIAIDEKRRKKITLLNELQSERNEVARAIGEKKRAGEDATEVMKRAAAIKEEIADIQRALDEADELTATLEVIPNILADDVPCGNDESDNIEIRSWGQKRNIKSPKQHFELGENIGQMNFENAAKMSGSRFVLLRDKLALLERALANFMLDLHSKEHGYMEVVPPVLVRSEALYGTGQLPKFADDLFITNTNHYLIPTSEVPLTNIVANEILAESELPLRYTAYSNCFRAEAGAAGKDTRGMIRQHQFSKVELVSIVSPEKSDDELERKLQCAEEVLKRLDLPYRVMLLCSGDTGFSAKKTYDIEVWLPGQGQYREISSCSNCGDFQARRMKARFKKENSKTTDFVHTLNGSGLAIGRTIVAILENYQNDDGSISVPEILREYIGGIQVIK